MHQEKLGIFIVRDPIWIGIPNALSIKNQQREIFQPVFKVIHPKYYKHLKKVLTKSIWSDKKWAGFWQISLYIK